MFSGEERRSSGRFNCRDPTTSSSGSSKCFDYSDNDNDNDNNSDHHNKENLVDGFISGPFHPDPLSNSVR